MTELAQQANAIVLIQGDDGGTAGVPHDLEIRDRAVGQRDPLQIKIDDFSAVNELLVIRHVCLRPLDLAEIAF